MHTAGAARRLPCPSPFASVMDWMWLSTPLNRCVFLKHNCTKTLQWVALCCKVATWLKQRVVQVGLSYWHVSGPYVTIITIWSALTTARPVTGYGNVKWPERQEISRVGQDFSKGKAGIFEGKILLAQWAHWNMEIIYNALKHWHYCVCMHKHWYSLIGTCTDGV